MHLRQCASPVFSSPVSRRRVTLARRRVRRGPRALGLVALCGCAWVCLDAGTPPTRADEAKILRTIEAFFSTQDGDRREQLAHEIEADPAYERGKLTGWLHRAVPFEALDDGMRDIQVPLPDGQSRTVVLRVPPRYDPHKAWPLIYALHGTRGSGQDAIGYIVHVLGSAADEYVIAAPTGYGEAGIHDDKWPPLMEHPAALLAVKKAVHVDSDRVFVMGVSRGGHAAWTLAVLHADQFAGAVSVAGTFLLPEDDGLWGVFLPNLANVRVLAIWGAKDITGPDLRTASPNGGIAGLNRKLLAQAAKAGLAVVGHEDPDQGHRDVRFPTELLPALLEQRRPHYPPQVQHAFRHIYQAQAYWLEGQTWTGSQWTTKMPTINLREGENIDNPEHVRQAALRTFRSMFGELRGKIDGQALEVHRKKVSALTIWIGDGMIDWDKPVTVKVSGERAFAGQLQPDLFVCLSQAARTYDFERLRWAGLRFKSGAKTQVVTGRTEFPPPERGK